MKPHMLFRGGLPFDPFKPSQPRGSALERRPFRSAGPRRGGEGRAAGME